MADPVVPLVDQVYWPFDDAKGTVAMDADGVYPATLNGSNWQIGKKGAAVQLGGHSWVDTGARFVDTSKSFTVDAWVQIDDLSTWATAVSQDGAMVSAFYLQYTAPYPPATEGTFAFSLPASDSVSSLQQRVLAPFSPVAHVWYHIAGVYNATSQQARLYVNGALVGQVAVSSSWSARGHTTIGRALWAGLGTDYWHGLIDEVHVFNRALSAGDVQALYRIPSPLTPLRPPAVPLIVRSPYVSTWQASDIAPGTWSTFWTGAIKAITGMVRVDGTPYLFLGAPSSPAGLRSATQIQLELTSTQSRYVFAAGPVLVYANFLSPVEPRDLQQLSVPWGYISLQAQSIDGNPHAVSLYMDVSGEWAHGTSNAPINWAYTTEGTDANAVNVFAVNPATPIELAETDDYASWGTEIFAATGPGMSFEAGPDVVVRTEVASTGRLANRIDTNMPRAIAAHWPVFAYNFELGSLSGAPSAPIVFALGNVRTPAVSLLGVPVPPYWETYWSNWQTMLVDTYADAISATGAFARANALDSWLGQSTMAAGGIHYAAICALAFRQAFGAVELVGSAGEPEYFLKEISSNGNVCTVDVLYPSMPVFLATNPNLVRLLLTPVFNYAESGNWPQPFAEHDLGVSYPNATAHNDGGGENMPVEESANMLLMTASYMFAAASGDANAFASSHYATMRNWAEYLVANTLDPDLQDHTDDFTGPIAHSSNLALKGILALGAMSKMATVLGNHPADAQRYATIASSYITQWVQKSMDSSNKHLKLAYDMDGTWSLKYNAFLDRLLNLSLIPTSVLQLEAEWCKSHEQPYGIPLDVRHTYTKLDWQLWTAASTDDLVLRQALIDGVYNFANSTPQRVPLSDWYDAVQGTQIVFRARPVVGGVFSLLNRVQAGH